MPVTRSALLVLLLGALAATVPTTRADDLTTNNGKKITGKLVGIDALGATFTVGESKVVVSGKDVVVIDLGNKVAAPAKDAKLVEIELTDGSTFRAGKFLVKGRKIEAELATVPEKVPPPVFELPLGSVFSVMRGAEDPKNRDAWKRILSGRGKRDLYVTGRLDSLSSVQGTILSGDEAGTALKFERENGEKVDLLLRSATGGLVFAQPTPEKVAPTLCKVVDVFGNELVAQGVQLSAEGIIVTTVSGVVVRYPATTGIAKFDYAQGNVAYLSDLDPKIDAPAVPADEKGLRTNANIPILRDRGVSGDPLKFGNDIYPKGLVIAAETVLTFNIGGDYREFKAVLGVPESTPDANLESKVTIEADGRPIFTETIKRKDKPKPIGLDLKGVKQLRVIVESDLPVNGNRVVLADARIQK